MNREEVWGVLPVRIKNLALAIAREYGHGWAQSSAVPPAGEWWEEPEDVPALAEIESGTPEGPSGKGIASPCVYESDSGLVYTHTTSSGRMSIVVRWSESDGETYTVRVSRPNGRSAWGTYAVDRGEFETLGAESTAWGPRHFAAWHRAWSVFGLSPEFPEVAREWAFDLTEQGIPRGGPLEYATVNIRAGGRVRSEDLYDCLRVADAVYVHGANGGSVRVVAQD